MCFFFFKQKTAYEMRISDWSSDVCSSDLASSQAWQRRRDGGYRSCFRVPLAEMQHVDRHSGAQYRRQQIGDGHHEACGGQQPERPARPPVEARAVRVAREHHRLEVAAEQQRSEEHTSELQSLMRISYAVFCLKKKKNTYHNI